MARRPAAHTRSSASTVTPGCMDPPQAVGVSAPRSVSWKEGMGFGVRLDRVVVPLSLSATVWVSMMGRRMSVYPMYPSQWVSLNPVGVSRLAKKFPAALRLAIWAATSFSTRAGGSRRPSSRSVKSLVISRGQGRATALTPVSASSMREGCPSWMVGVSRMTRGSGIAWVYPSMTMPVLGST